MKRWVSRVADVIVTISIYEMLNVMTAPPELPGTWWIGIFFAATVVAEVTR